jgi:spore coat protein U-like protein
MDFGRHSAILQEKVTSSIINTAATWNIKCTEKLPVNIILDGGENLSNNIRRMKHISSSEYINYKLYTSNSLDTEYLAGNSYSIQPTTAANPILDFSIYGVADLDNNNQPRSAGIYKDTVSILITW